MSCRIAPDVLKYNIMPYLDYAELFTAAMVCKEWRRYAHATKITVGYHHYINYAAVWDAFANITIYDTRFLGHDRAMNPKAYSRIVILNITCVTDYNAIPCMPLLKVVYINGNVYALPSMHFINTCPLLTDVTIANYYITNSIASQLIKMPLVQTLTLTKCVITNLQLKKFTNVRTLTLRSCLSEKISLKLHNLPLLTNLTLWHHVEKLTIPPTVTHLSITHSHHTIEIPAFVTSLHLTDERRSRVLPPSITDLMLSFCTITQDMMAPLINLQSLVMRDCQYMIDDFVFDRTNMSAALESQLIMPR